MFLILQINSMFLINIIRVLVTKLQINNAIELDNKIRYR